MKSPLRCLCRPRRRLVAAVALALASASLACGPEFPNSYYDMPEHQLLRAPEGSFTAEIARIATEVKLRFTVPPKDERPPLEVELAGLRSALAAQGVRGTEGREIEAGYEQFRQALDAWANRNASDDVRRKPAEPFEEELPKNLPAEFSHYLLGAVSWHAGEWEDARRLWQSVLELPQEQRRYRSTWAAFMLGRASLMIAEKRYASEAAQEARVWFKRTRELAAVGFSDPLGLGWASVGWDARALLRQRDYAGAIELYLQQQVGGESSARESLRIAASQAAGASREAQAKLAQDPLARRVLTAYLISRFSRAEGSPEPTERLQQWATTLRESGVRDVPDAERMAWLAYDAGLFPLAWEWIALASETVAEAQWLRAKLTLRGGDLAGGERLLRTALESKALSTHHRSRVAAELARVCLARDDFAGALTASMAGGHWEDAAYVAERVMTATELKTFVDALPPTVAEVEGGGVEGWPRHLPVALRHLLARRLARLGKTDAATAYFPEPLRRPYLDYVAGVKRGYDRAAAAAERAAGFWAAAQIVRAKGMEILGTELEPDWAIWEGYHDMTSSSTRRPPRAKRDPIWGHSLGKDSKAEPSIWLPTELESERVWDQPAPEKRFHYRYRAAELAWWAASLLPNESDETAKILATAGGWLKARDPAAAKPFYQALVIRCGSTELGCRAEARRWFPQDETPKDREL